MDTRKLALRLAGTVFAAAAAGMLLLALWGHAPPLDLEIWAPLIGALSGFTSAVLFITADALESEAEGRP